MCLIGPLSSAPRVCAAETITTEVCVYGATSGGVIAAVQAKRMQKTVALASFNTHVGGMTSGGLGWVDFGKSEAIGGLTAEYFKRIGQHYGKTGPGYAVEPHVAEEEFNTLLATNNVPIRFNQRLASVTSTDGRISQIVMEDGTIYRAKMFIDASYEGDLMAKAGVSFALGRESVAQYDESFAGVRSEPWKVPVSPYIVPGKPESGLLPLIGEDAGIANGEADKSLMSCNYRLCLTQDPANKIPITAPAGYQESTYELLGRLIDAKVAEGAALQLTTFIKISRLPNGKTDINNQFSVSTDFIGESHSYPTASYAERDAIEQSHRNYIQGLLYYLGTSPHVPAPIRAQMQTWGFCADEFKDTGGWPHQLYVREARRLIGDYVMLQQNVQGKRLAPESVGLASYRVDSHSLNRFVRDGVLMTDGDLHDAYPKPYPISYRSIVPKKGECQNLFVPFALSASHVAFTSIRMEPVFMILSQSAATAAAQAIDGNLAVQDVAYDKLHDRLLADGQIMEWQENTKK
ncbi:FAD-dependent oxidoreductase [bacterium]|nr:MAG: FAD-dependent oxidoreductase [bacterium]